MFSRRMVKGCRQHCLHSSKRQGCTIGESHAWLFLPVCIVGVCQCQLGDACRPVNWSDESLQERCHAVKGANSPVSGTVEQPGNYGDYVQGEKGRYFYLSSWPDREDRWAVLKSIYPYEEGRWDYVQYFAGQAVEIVEYQLRPSGTINRRCYSVVPRSHQPAEKRPGGLHHRSHEMTHNSAKPAHFLLVRPKTFIE